MTRKSSSKKARKSSAKNSASSSSEAEEQSVVDDSPRKPAESAVEKWMLEGNNTDDIKDALKNYYPSADPDEAIQKAIHTFVRYGKQDSAALRGWCMAAMRDLYHQMRAVGDFPGALRAVKELDKFAEEQSAADGIDIDI